MKKTQIFRGLLLAFLAFQFFSCETEPYTDEIPQGGSTAPEGQFRAVVGNNEFIADSVSAVIDENNRLFLTGTRANGEMILLEAANPAEANFNLTSDGTGGSNRALYDGASQGLPYVSLGESGGSGQLKITEMDTVARTLTGTFSFLGVRVKTDESGMPVIGSNGEPVLEEKQIKEGAFNSIPYTGGEGSGGDPTVPPTDPETEFFAKVDGIAFDADSVEVTEPLIGNSRMIKIIARNADRDMIRIDIPRSLGTGTFDMENISDGTKLIGIYKKNGPGDPLTSNPGSITISEFDLVAGVLKADFNFTGNDPTGQDPGQVEVTEGSLTVYFEGVPGANNRLSARINGNSYEPENLEISRSVVSRYPRITVSTRVDDQELVISFPETLEEGSYEMEPEVEEGDEINGTYTPVVGTSIQYVSAGGSFVITNFDRETGIVEGSFNFTAEDASGQDPTVYQITAGEFFIIIP